MAREVKMLATLGGGQHSEEAGRRCLGAGHSLFFGLNFHFGIIAGLNCVPLSPTWYNLMEVNSSF